MKKIKVAAISAAMGLIVLNSGFISNKEALRKDYGFVSAKIINDSLYQYTLIDLSVLDKIKSDYSCVVGGEHCHIIARLNTVPTKKKGFQNEIIEVTLVSKNVKVLGKGFRFSYEMD